MREQLGLLDSFGDGNETSTNKGQQQCSNNNWLMFELLWRDFFR